MNHYTLAEMTPGLSESFTVTITEEMMARFEAITGDVSPIHMDAEYAQKRGYPGRVVYGMLGASFFSTLAGVYLPGEHCLLHGVECKFAKPIFIGDTLTVKGTVVSVSEIGSEAEIKAVITNQDGKRVTRGIINQGPDYPIVNLESHKRWQWLSGLTIVMMLVMFVMMVAFWQYKGTTPLQTASFIIFGLLIYTFNLPTSIHLYKKARNLLHR